MRAFFVSSIPSAAGGRSGRPAPLALASFVLLLACVPPAEAGTQWPGEVRGRVLDEATGRPVAGAEVAAPSSGLRARTDAGGAFRLRGLEPGALRLRITALGYAETTATLEVENGAVARPVIELPPAPVSVPGVRAMGRRRRDPSVVVLDRSALVASGARTAGRALESVPGVTVHSRGSGGAESVSIRGSDPDEVLVLLDGAPLNDPITGTADLSTVPTASLERVTVLAGARSARFGPRAQAGAVVLESRAARIPTRTALRAGSLGRLGGEAGASGALDAVRVGGTASAERMDGGFDFQRPPEVGGGSAHRENAELARLGAQGSLDADVKGGELAVRLGGETLERGIPGKSFAPSDSAAQELVRARFSARWRGSGPAGVLTSASSYLTAQRVRFRDPAPPLGRPFDDRTELARSGLRLEAEGAPGPSWLGAVAGGIEAHHARVRSDALADGARTRRTDGAAWIRSGVEPDAWPASPRFDASLRLHREGIAGGWWPAHDVTLSLRPAGVDLHLSHRSAFSPPTLGDQFFREGVGVRPNPELRAERIPSEVEVGASWSGRVEGAEVDAGLSAYTADVKGMIVWAPDFRFVWSPRNVDVKRRGLESWVGVRWPGPGLGLDGSFSRARVVYDREGPDTVQVRYRPRHTATLRAGWEGEGHAVRIRARYLGTRYPVPAPVNALAPFWTVDLDLRRDWRWSGWALRTALAVERLLDRTDAFLFGFPEPGRTYELSVEVRPPD